MKHQERTLQALKGEAAAVTAVSDVVALFDRFLSGADTESRKAGLGRTSYVVTAKGDEVETAFKLVEASLLVPSNSLDGRINPDYPQELQPRDRTRQSSVMQISKMAGNLRPAQLADSGLSSHGAPIVGRDGVVESGNGRTMSIIKAYIEGKANGYREYLLENAAIYGFKREKVESMREPVLVRERLTDVDRAKFARDSNLSDLQSMSAAETAWVDAERIDDRMMELFNPSDAGNLLARQNQSFIHAFLNEIGDQDTAGLLTADGRPTKQMIDRMQNAIFAKAYKNEKLVKLVAEEPDPEIRNILTALNNAASSFVQMQYLSGEAHKQTSGALIDAVDGYANSSDESRDSLADGALDALVSATELVREAKDSGQNIDELIAQGSLFGPGDPNAEALARFIAANNRSAKRLSHAFKLMADEINDELTRQGSAAGDLFGGFSVTLVDILVKVSASLEQEYGEGLAVQQSMFESVDDDANQAATSPLNDLPEPTEGQKRAGNYKKGRVKFAGFDIAIENPRGSIRSGTDVDGIKWAIEMNHHYGDLSGTKGADGDPIDVFLGENESPVMVFVVNQVDQEGQFDEHKVMLGFDSVEDARRAYMANYDDDWQGVGSIIELSMQAFRSWLRFGDMSKPLKAPSSMMLESLSPAAIDRMTRHQAMFG